MPDSIFPPKKTRIISTVGPSCSSEDILTAMITAGMNIARINFAHGDLENHRKAIHSIRRATQKADQRVAIMGDLPGPKMRIGKLSYEPITLIRGESFTLQINSTIGDQSHASLDFPDLTRVVHIGDSIFINDGYIHLKVKGVFDGGVRCEVIVGGELRSFKGVNFPGIDLGIQAFTEQDQPFLVFAAECGIDAVCASFVQDEQDILALKQACSELSYDPLVIAKIERSKALENIESILAVSDGIMVARGDLGVEIPIEEITSVQKRLIQLANLHSIPVITATQMLESMIHNSRPTRAEATDVTNAILDGSDCVMLSGETAVGEYPVEVVQMMAHIAACAEKIPAQPLLPQILEERSKNHSLPIEDEISLSAYQTALMMEPVVILTPAATGNTVRRISRFKLPVWIVAFSERESTLQRLMFSSGVLTVFAPHPPEHWGGYATDWACKHGISEGLAMLLEGGGTLRAHDTTRLELIRL